MIEFTNFKLVPVPLERNQYEVLLWTFDFSTYIKLDLDRVNFQGRTNYGLPDPASRLENRSEVLLDLVNEGFKKALRSLLDAVETRKIIRNRWACDVNTLISRSEMYSRLIKDMPGFQMGAHVDNQFIIGNVILNLADNPCGTQFHKIKTGFFNKEVYFEAPRKKNKGIFFLNTPGALHSIKNDSNVPRYVLNSYWQLI